MTLIIAESNEDEGFFVADTLLTVVPSKFNSGPFNGKYHALKVHILTDKFCIALAGNYELGLNVINQVANYVSVNTALLQKRFNLQNPKFWVDLNCIDQIVH